MLIGKLANSQLSQHEFSYLFCPTDVDECVEGLHTCHPETEICINEIGKYRCEALSINEVDFGVNPYEALPRATFQPPVQECAEGFGYDLNTKRCLGRYIVIVLFLFKRSRIL